MYSQTTLTIISKGTFFTITQSLNPSSSFKISLTNRESPRKKLPVPDTSEFEVLDWEWSHDDDPNGGILWGEEWEIGQLLVDERVVWWPAGKVDEVGGVLVKEVRKHWGWEES